MLKMEAQVIEILSKISNEYVAQANYPNEEGETWSYQTLTELKAQLLLCHKMGLLQHDPEILTLLLYQNAQYLDSWLVTATSQHYEAFAFLQSLNLVCKIYE